MGGMGTENDEYATALELARDDLGRRVRQVWIAWAQEQPEPKPSWLVPYDDLPEADKEADRRIGSALWGDGFSHGYETGATVAKELAVLRLEDVHNAEPQA